MVRHSILSPSWRRPGFDWRTTASVSEGNVMEITFGAVIPILRIFDIGKADEFYQEFLGFSVDWDHRFDADASLYRQISRGNLVLHLSEHHGDSSPGVALRVMM
jgi:hypothetical protein